MEESLWGMTKGHINIHQTRNRTLLADLNVKNKCWVHAECVGVRLKAGSGTALQHICLLSCLVLILPYEVADSLQSCSGITDTRETFDLTDTCLQ